MSDTSLACLPHSRGGGAAMASMLPFPFLGDSALFEVLHPSQGNPRQEHRLGEELSGQQRRTWRI